MTTKTPTTTRPAMQGKPIADSVRVSRSASGGISITPTATGCIVLRGVGVTVYDRSQVPAALVAIRSEVEFSEHLEGRVMENPLIRELFGPAGLRDGLTADEQRSIAREQEEMHATERAFTGISQERYDLLTKDGGGAVIAARPSGQSAADSAKREAVTVAEQAAALLLSDIRSAHRLTCVAGATVADRLLSEALLPLISDACTLRDRLNALRLALEEGK